MPNIHFAVSKDNQVTYCYHCDQCNTTLDVTGLVKHLLKYDRDTCPKDLYQAWKILRLGASEYRMGPGGLTSNHKEHQILESACLICQGVE